MVALAARIRAHEALMRSTFDEVLPLLDPATLPTTVVAALF